MNTQAQALLQTILALPEAERAEIAASLIDSLDPAVDADVAEAWEKEIQRRLESTDRGEVELISWDVVMNQLRSRRHE